VSRDYFDLVGLRIEEGRGFQASDDDGVFPVAVVSRATADRYWPDEDPMGRRLQVYGEERWLQVVGVVSDVRNTSDSELGEPNIYLPYAQEARLGMYLVARTNTDPSVLAGPVRQAIRSVDANQPVDAILTMDRALYRRNGSRSALLTLFVTFAIFALLMSAIGIYGVMAYSVSQRQNEIGLRMAVGAERSTIRWMIVSQGTRLLAAGIAVGLLAAFGISRLLGNLVFGISTTDPLTFIGVPAILVAVALVANLVPAGKAVKMDPAVTLRGE
jgi:putative ABC transport system permease protein